MGREIKTLISDEQKQTVKGISKDKMFIKLKKKIDKINSDLNLIDQQMQHFYLRVDSFRLLKNQVRQIAQGGDKLELLYLSERVSQFEIIFNSNSLGRIQEQLLIDESKIQEIKDLNSKISRMIRSLNRLAIDKQVDLDFTLPGFNHRSIISSPNYYIFLRDLLAEDSSFNSIESRIIN